MAIRNYTSGIDPKKTAGEIQQILAEYGAQKIMFDYNGREVKSISFLLQLGDDRPISYRLEPDVRGTLLALDEDSGVPPRYVNEEQARRTAWRNQKDWLDAQLALVASTSTTLEELLLGYAITDSGETFYDRLESAGDRLLQEGIV